jgi:PAS domain S-box-containing protein
MFEIFDLSRYVGSPTQRLRSWVGWCAFVLVCFTVCLTLWHAVPRASAQMTPQASVRAAPDAGAQPSRSVLVLYQGDLSYPSVGLIDREIRDVFEKQPQYHVNLYIDYMGDDTFQTLEWELRLHDRYLQKQGGHRPDVIIAIGGETIRYMLEFHDNDFSGVPVVLCNTIGAFPNNSTPEKQFTGTWMELDPVNTLEAALRLQPRTKQVIVVNGASELEKKREDLLRSSFRKYEDKLQFTYLRGLPMPELLDRLRHTAAGTIIMFGFVASDSTGRLFIPATESLPMIIGAANAPVFTFADSLVGRGSVGGSVMSYANQGRIAAEDALKILGGVKPADIPYAKAPSVYLFDWRALERWGMKESDLPAGSTVLNRQPSFLEQYGRYVVGILAVIFAQLFTILALLNRKARLRESEERFRTMVDGTPVMVWIAGADNRCTDFNRGWLAFTGRTLEQECGDGWTEGVHRDDLKRCMADYLGAFEKRAPFSIEYRLRRYDGRYRWVSDSGSPRFLPDGKFAGYIGCCFDIDDRKSAESTNHELARRLMSAQEEERSRIARELHDGIGQELSVVIMQLHKASEAISPQSKPRSAEMEKAIDKLRSICSEVGSLSHQLHSSELEILGLTAAINNLCREFSEQYPIQIAYECKSIPAKLQGDLSLAVLRIVQESLHNVAKHSGAKSVQVDVSGASEELRVLVHDDGIGFAMSGARGSAGLGLISMRERIYLVGGEFSIESAPGAGTSVRVRIPLVAVKAPVEHMMDLPFV